MSIEVRQLVVKSNVQQRSETDEDSAQDPGEVMDSIREECRKLILEILREMRER